MANDLWFNLQDEIVADRILTARAHQPRDAALTESRRKAELRKNILASSRLFAGARHTTHGIEVS